MNIVVTLPKSIKWTDFEKELAVIADESHQKNWKVTHFPTNTKSGDRLYVVYNGYIRGWLKITAFQNLDFVCMITNNRMVGKFVSCSGPFRELKPLRKMQGFQGWRYFGT